MSTSRYKSASRKMVLFLAVLGLGGVLGSDAARAADEVDIAVDAFAIGGRSVGVSIGSAEKELVKSLVRCVVSGKSKSIPDCARDEVINRLPQEARSYAQCLVVEGKTVEQCALSGVISKLPPQARQITECIATRGDVAQCGKNFAMDQLSQAEQAALKEAFATLDKLKIDDVARNPLTDTPNSILNIVKVAEGIRQKDWGKVVRYGGREVAKAAAKIVVRTVLPPPVAAALDPAVDALVEQRFDLVEGIITAAWGGDERRLGELYVEAFIYTNTPVVMVCALMPSGAIKEAICGLAGKVISALAGAGGDVGEWTSDRITDAYNGFSDALTGRGNNCGTREEYYGWHFAACKHHAVLAKHMDVSRYTEIESSLYMGCRHDMHRCAKRLIGSTSDRISDICDPIRERFKREVDELSGRMREAAAAYARSYSVTLNIELNEDCDARAGQRFFMDCTRALLDQFPDVLRAPQCKPDGGRPLGPAGTLANVCSEASFVGDENDLRLNFRAKCVRPLSVETKPAVMQMPIPSSIKDRLTGPAGVEETRPAVEQMPNPDSIKLKPTWAAEPTPTVERCPSPAYGTRPNCKCPPRWQWSGARCIPMQRQTPVPQQTERQCPGGFVGHWPRCYRPSLQTPQAERQCPGGFVGHWPRCYRPQPQTSQAVRHCPVGFVGYWPRCYRPQPQTSQAERQCPGGFGHWPRCYRPSLQTPQAERQCPAGSFGRWPRCRRPQEGKCPPGSTGRWPRCGAVVR